MHSFEGFGLTDKDGRDIYTLEIGSECLSLRHIRSKTLGMYMSKTLPLTKLLLRKVEKTQYKGFLNYNVHHCCTYNAPDDILVLIDIGFNGTTVKDCKEISFTGRNGIDRDNFTMQKINSMK